MKVLQINKYHYRRAGAESVFFNTMELLRKHGHEVIPFTIKHPLNLESEYSDFFVDAPEIRDMKVRDKIKSIPRFFLNKNASMRLEKLLEQEKPDIAHLHNIFNGLSLSILPILAKHNVPVVITLHDTRFICPTSEYLHKPMYCRICRKTGYLTCFFNRCFEGSVPHSFFTMLEMVHKDFVFNYDKYIDRYIFLNSFYLQEHIKRHSHFKEKNDILYNFFPGTIEAKPYRGDYFLYFGRITAEKGVETLLNAAKRLPNIKFKFAGTGPLFEKLKQEAPENVEMLGYLTGNALSETIKNASFIVVPSEWEENNPMAVIESNSYGKPVIGSDKKGIIEILRDGKTGFIFPEGNLERLVDTISLASNITDIQYAMMSENALTFAKENFDSEVHYSRLMDIYRKAMDHCHKRV